MDTATAKKIGEKGGKVRASRLTPSERSAESSHANAVRWERQRERDRLTAEVIEAAKRIHGVAEWRDRDNAGPGVVVEAMADVTRLADALDALEAL